ncbi:MAG: PepSY-associated TM helix domain-containing protein [Candidatus Obscuribacterales bacterium]
MKNKRTISVSRLASTASTGNRETAPAVTGKPFYVFFLKTHSLTGGILAAYILLMSLTGTSLVFADRLVEATNPVPGNSASNLDGSASLSAILEKVRKSYPDYRVKWLHLSPEPGTATEVYIEAGSDNSLKNTVLVDPGNGKILGERNRIIQFLMNLHFDLLSGKTGRTINGLMALCLIIIVTSGAAVWWRGPSRIKERLVISGFRNPALLRRQIHQCLAFFVLPMLLVWAISALYFAFPKPFEGMTRALLQDAGTAPAPAANSRVDCSNPDTMVREAAPLAPGLLPAWLKIPAREGDEAAVYFRPLENARDKEAMTRIFVDTRTGKVTGILEPTNRTSSQTATAILKKLHFGTIAGIWSQTLWLFLGLTPAVLAITGLSMLYHKKARRR